MMERFYLMIRFFNDFLGIQALSQKWQPGQILSLSEYYETPSYFTVMRII